MKLKRWNLHQEIWIAIDLKEAVDDLLDAGYETRKEIIAALEEGQTMNSLKFEYRKDEN